MPPNSPAPARASGRWPRATEDVHHWNQGNSSATVRIFGRRVVGAEVVGTFGRDAISVIKPPIEALLQGSTGVHAFWDVEEMVNYEAEVRDSFIQLFRAQRSQWANLHVLFRSALIGMTVSAVGLVFGGALKSYRNRDEFYAVVERTLSEIDAAS